MNDLINTVYALILGFVGSTIGGLIIRALYQTVFKKLASGIAILEEKGKITAERTVLNEKQEIFEGVLSSKIDTLISTVSEQNEKIGEYRELIDYHTARDERVLQVISDILQNFTKKVSDHA